MKGEVKGILKQNQFIKRNKAHLVAVSYTHLDVYKRQGKGGSLPATVFYQR